MIFNNADRHYFDWLFDFHINYYDLILTLGRYYSVFGNIFLQNHNFLKDLQVDYNFLIWNPSFRSTFLL